MRLGECRIKYGVVGTSRIWLENLPRELFDAIPGNEQYMVPDDSREPSYYLKVFRHNRLEFRCITLEGKDGRIDGVMDPISSNAIIPLLPNDRKEAIA